jgi:RNA polymerase sigma-70 factor (ECF subfamily)
LDRETVRQKLAQLTPAELKSLVGFFRHRLPREVDPKDPLQEMVIRALRGAEAWRGEGTFEAWLWGIAHKVVKDFLRTALRRRKRAILASDRWDEPDAEPEGTKSGAEAEVQGDERKACIRAALSSLDPEHGRVIELHVFGGLTHPEIAERLGLTEAQVKNRIREGYRVLREKLEGL